MIVPGKKPYKVPDMRMLNRIFIRFIDKNNIQLECENDIPRVIQLFTESVEYQLRIEWENDDD